MTDKFWQAIEQNNMVAVFDLNGVFTYVNQKYCFYSKYESSDLLGKSIRLLGATYHTNEFYQNFWQTIQKGEVWQDDMCCSAKDTSLFWANFQVIPLRNENGELSEFLVRGEEITEKKQREITLKHFRQALDQTRENIFIVDAKDGKSIDVNDRACQTFEYQQEELIGKKITDLITDEHLKTPQSWAKFVQLVKNKGKASYWERGTYQRKSGSAFQGEISAVYEEFQGKPYLIGLVRDITEQLQNEEILKQSEANLDATINHTPFYIWSIDRNFRLLTFNEKYAEQHTIFYGKRPQKGDYLLAETDKSNLEFWQPLCEKALNGEAFKEEFEFRAFFIEIAFNPIFVQKEVIGITIYVQDISDRKRNEQKILENTQILGETQTIARLGYWKFDPRSKKIEWSSQIFASFGLSPESEAPSFEEYQKLIHPEDLPKLIKSIQFALNEGLPYSIELRHLQPDGTSRWMFVKAMVERDKKGKINLLKGINLDIDERKQIEEKLQQTLEVEQKLNEELITREEELTANEETLRQINQILLQSNEELTKINNELDRFVYSASHDLRAPIASILGLITLCRMTDSIYKINEYLDLQEISIRRLDGFIRDILDYSQNTRAEVKRESIDFKELIEQVLEQYSFLENFDKIEKQIQIKQKHLFYSDNRRLSVVFSNLISNAIRYANIHQNRPWIKINIEVKAQSTHIEVRDNGIGIEEEHLEKIFDMFYRATNLKSGSGLGLYIVKETLQKLKGQIKVESVENKGTTFHLEIPNLGAKILNK